MKESCGIGDEGREEESDNFSNTAYEIQDNNLNAYAEEDNYDESDICNINGMEGHEFEHFCADLLC